jgi:hypothetical protein
VEQRRSLKSGAKLQCLKSRALAGFGFYSLLVCLEQLSSGGSPGVLRGGTQAACTQALQQVAVLVQHGQLPGKDLHVADVMHESVLHVHADFGAGI